MKGVENYDGVNDSDGELTLSMNILNNQIGFSPRSPSSLRMLSHNSKTRSDGIGTTSRDDRRQGGSNEDAQYYGHKFIYDSNDQVYNRLTFFFLLGLNAILSPNFADSQF
jgi:hypothetical protein